MDRRNFLKRIAAVAAGAVAVPMITKSESRIRPGLDKYQWVQVYGPYCPGEVNAAPVDYLNKVSRTPRHELGALAFTGDGRHYRYMKNYTTKQLIAGVLC